MVVRSWPGFDDTSLLSIKYHMPRLAPATGCPMTGVEVFRDGAWAPVAQAIGRMKIDHFPAISASRVSLLLSGADAAQIREFQLFDVGAAATR
ncbi:hypothetical protein [Xanthomonas sp. 1678]|uniref:hypothetical protein n=1 Tax=Xanthomonas sp. 1678 TaxID=3158788 RepID=UPI0028559483|nr:hypothetical protein [Xanthomonas translucens]